MQNDKSLYNNQILKLETSHMFLGRKKYKRRWQEVKDKTKTKKTDREQVTEKTDTSCAKSWRDDVYTKG